LVFVESTLSIYHVVIELEFSRKFSEKSSNKNFIKILSLRTELFHTDERRTDGRAGRHTDGIQRDGRYDTVFRNFAKAYYNITLFKAICNYNYTNNFVNIKLRCLIKIVPYLLQRFNKGYLITFGHFYCKQSSVMIFHKSRMYTTHNSGFRQEVGEILKGQQFRFLNLEGRTDRLPRNVGKKLALCAA